MSSVGSRRARWLHSLAVALLAAGALAAVPSPAAAVPGGTAAAPPLQCVDNGTSGNRVQLLYTYEPGTSRFAEREPLIRAAAWVAQQNVNDSARREGAQRWIRFLTTATGCQLTVHAVQVPAGSTNSSGWISTLQSLGYGASNRIYAIYSENHRANCAGTQNAGINNDDRPGTGNLHNSRAVWITFQPSCFTGHTLTHELAHGLGGILPGAPNYDGGGHCTDGYETLCQGGSAGVCSDPLAVRLLDCGRDDYFAITPQGGYLPTHWNAGQHSLYLHHGAATPALTTIPPLPPQLLRAADVEGTSIAFGFQPSVEPYGSGYTVDYQLLRNGTVVATMSSWQTTVRLTGLAANTSASYTVRQRLTFGGVTRTSATSQALAVTTNSSTAQAGAVEAGATMIFTNDVVDPAGPAMALDLFAFSEAENATIVQWPRNGAVNQHWKLAAATGGGYTVSSPHSLKCLTPLGGGTSVGTPVVQATCNGTAAQRWTFPVLTGLTYQIRASSSQLCVQASGGGTGAGAGLVLATCSASAPTQRWTAHRFA